MATLNDIETKIQRIIDKLSTKTIKGTLPLTFITHTAGNAVDWTIEGNADGVGERTITTFTDWESGTTITGAEQVGKPYAECKRNTSLTTRRRSVSIVPVVSGVATLNITSGYQAADIHFDKDGLYIGNTASYHSNGYQISISDNVKYASLVVKKSDNSEFTEADVWDVYFTYSGANAYKIPLLVTSGQQSNQHTLYIGDAPLTEGETVSKTSTGVDLELLEGKNTVSTTLYNKPEMTIKYKYNGGN